MPEVYHFQRLIRQFFWFVRFWVKKKTFFNTFNFNFVHIIPWKTRVKHSGVPLLSLGPILRERFDTLVCKISELEKEKISLIGTIKNAAASNSNIDGSRGGKRGGDHSKDAAVTEAVKERLKVIDWV